MKFRAVMFDPQDRKSVRSFLRFPASLYTKNTLMQDPETEAAILGGTHILSHYFSVYPFWIQKSKDRSFLYPKRIQKFKNRSFLYPKRIQKFKARSFLYPIWIQNLGSLRRARFYRCGIIKARVGE